MLFGLIKPNDWKIVHKEEGAYSTLTDMSFNREPNPYYAYLSYSKSRNKYKITCTEYTRNYKSQLPYQACLNKQILLESDS